MTRAITGNYNPSGFRSQSSATSNNSKPAVTDTPPEEMSVKMQVSFVIHGLSCANHVPGHYFVENMFLDNQCRDGRLIVFIELINDPVLI